MSVLTKNKYSTIANEILDGAYCAYGKDTQEYEKWYTQRYSGENKRNLAPIYKRFCREVSADTENGRLLKEHLLDLYWNQEYGYKWIYHYEIDTSYTMLRTLFDLLGIEGRKGRSVSTKNLSKIRSDKAKREWKLGIGYGDPNVQIKTEKTERGIQGYYYNEAKQKYVWLRSTYEYIYARWLNSTNQNWDVETQVYYLEDNTRYRPDFFLYDESDNVRLIVEIKGYWTNRLYKVDMLREVLSIPISVIATDEIRNYMNKSYGLEIKEWKEKRLLQHQLKSSQ